jgi:hypothetical protein
VLGGFEVWITRSDLSMAKLQQAALTSRDYRLSCRLPAAGQGKSNCHPKELERFPINLDRILRRRSSFDTRRV